MSTFYLLIFLRERNVDLAYCKHLMLPDILGVLQRNSTNKTYIKTSCYYGGVKSQDMQWAR